MITDSYSVTATFIAKALHVWAGAGVNPRDGDFVEALSIDGEPLLDLPRRGRTQARQILTFAMAHVMGDDPDGRYLEVAKNGYRALQHRYLHNDDGLLMAINPDGSIADPHRNAYEHAFLLMAQGWLYRATAEQSYATDAESVWSWLENNLRDAQNDGFRVGIPKDRNDPRQQNPHMHLFETCLLNAKNIGGDKWRQRTDWLFSLFRRHFYDPEEGCVREFFEKDWQTHEGVGDRLDPGHQFEWTWLLGLYAESRREIPRELISLYAYGNRYGLADTELGWDEIYPRGEELRFTSRLWVQCEVLKAHLTLWKLTDNNAFREKADKVLSLITHHYLRVQSGCWIDQLDRNLKPISANSPASTLYHLYVAFVEYRKAVTRSDSRHTKCFEVN